MIYQINVLLESFMVFVLIFLAQRYVFLERGLEGKKQTWYYIISAVATLLTIYLVDEGVATSLMIILGGLNISLARKEHRISGFFLIIPILGMINGLVLPVLVLPVNIIEFSETGVLVFCLCIYLIFVAALLIFWIRGKEWRRNFREESEHRHLQHWERVLLCIIGILMICYSNFLERPMTGIRRTYDSGIAKQIIMNMCLMGVTAFILTVTSIVLIMQGNKRSYYHEKTMKMHEVEMEKRRAEDANEAKSAFLSNMSHEIRTPMNAIVGMTDILLREQQTPKTREYLNNIKNSGTALITIINDILDFSKIESGKLEIIEEEYEPMSMFHDVAMIFLNRIGNKNIELLYDIDKNMPTKLCGDAQRLRQVIINIVNNAIKFTDEGYVKLAVKVNELDGEKVELSFSIEDTGQGIKQEDMGKLFGSFQQVDTKKNRYKEGTGLGLAISKQLVELMNGHIGVESKYGEGSTFYFDLPQKVVDGRCAAVLKTEKGRNSVIGIKLANDIVKKHFMALADTYEVKCIDLTLKTSGTLQASEMQEVPEKVDFLVVDDMTQVSEEEKACLQEKEGVLCVLQNPMMENPISEKATMLNKPVYSLNFCQLLNHEQMVFRSTVEEMNFIAPQAKILVVDDNEMNLKVAKGLLEPFRMQIDTAINGQEALRMVQEQWYDIVFMDHMMPVMDGIEATRAIRGLANTVYRSLPIIALSANATAEAKEMFIKEGMDDFIAKPIKLKEINKCLLKWLPEDMVTYIEEVVNIPTEETASMTGEADSSTDKIPESLYAVEGIDVEEGIQNCGTEKLFLELIGDFYKLIDPKSAKLEQCLAEGRIRDYTIEVHALKNTARMIGAMELSELFYQMEQLGNAEEKEQIEARTPEVLALYRSYKELLAPYAQSEETETVQVSIKEIRETLIRLHNAVDSFDLDEADRAMKELESFVLPEECQPMLEQLSASVADVAMEDVMRLAEEMNEKLESFYCS